jgi:hypothetical protein
VKKVWNFPGSVPGHKKVFAVDTTGAQQRLIWGLYETKDRFPRDRNEDHVSRLFETDMTGRWVHIAGIGRGCSFEEIRETPGQCGDGGHPRNAFLDIQRVVVLNSGELVVKSRNDSEDGEVRASLWVISADRNSIRLLLSDGDSINGNKLEHFAFGVAASPHGGFLLHGKPSSRSDIGVWKATKGKASKGKDGSWGYRSIAGGVEQRFIDSEGEQERGSDADELSNPSAEEDVDEAGRHSDSAEMGGESQESDYEPEPQSLEELRKLERFFRDDEDFGPIYVEPKNLFARNEMHDTLFEWIVIGNIHALPHGFVLASCQGVFRVSESGRAEVLSMPAVCDYHQMIDEEDLHREQQVKVEGKLVTVFNQVSGSLFESSSDGTSKRLTVADKKTQDELGAEAEGLPIIRFDSFVVSPNGMIFGVDVLDGQIKVLAER